MEATTLPPLLKRLMRSYTIEEYRYGERHSFVASRIVAVLLGVATILSLLAWAFS